MKPFKEPQDSSDEKNPFAEPIVMPLEDVLDLHAFQPKEIASVVDE